MQGWGSNERETEPSRDYVSLAPNTSWNKGYTK
jgi:hypothetical protein